MGTSSGSWKKTSRARLSGVRYTFQCLSHAYSHPTILQIPPDKKVGDTNLSNTNNNPPTPPEGGGEPKGKKNSRQRSKAQAETLPVRFDGFWLFYRQHVPPDRNAGNRQKAIRAWDKLAPDDALASTMAAALAKQVKTEAWKSGIGVPHASTWLNNRGWEDDWGAAAQEQTPAGRRDEEWLN